MLITQPSLSKWPWGSTDLLLVFYRIDLSVNVIALYIVVPYMTWPSRWFYARDSEGNSTALDYLMICGIASSLSLLFVLCRKKSHLCTQGSLIVFLSDVPLIRLTFWTSKICSIAPFLAFKQNSSDLENGSDKLFCERCARFCGNNFLVWRLSRSWRGHDERHDRLGNLKAWGNGPEMASDIALNCRLVHCGKMEMYCLTPVLPKPFALMEVVGKAGCCRDREIVWGDLNLQRDCIVDASRHERSCQTIKRLSEAQMEPC